MLPDLAAGCSMADMAEIEQVEDCWEQLAEVIDVDEVMPVTYVNSAASLKAFCGRHGGIVCTSANARAVLDWAFAAAAARALLSRPAPGPQHGPARWASPLDEMPLWDPHREPLGGNSPGGHPPQPRAAVEGPLQRAPDVPARSTSPSSATSIRASRSSSIPSA